MSAFRRDLFGAVGSDLTSETYLVADAEEMTVQTWPTSATTLTIQGSNAQGFREAIAEGEWSTLTVMESISAGAILNIEPGFRWLRAIRESASSMSALYVAGRNVVRRA